MREGFMRQAIQLAIDNVRSGRGGPFAAIIARDAVILSTGTNVVTSTNDPTAHAEIVAIRAACAALGSFQLEGCDLSKRYAWQHSSSSGEPENGGTTRSAPEGLLLRPSPIGSSGFLNATLR
jgi:pyrimidine deaminase RibD-like protein